MQREEVGILKAIVFYCQMAKLNYWGKTKFKVHCCERVLAHDVIKYHAPKPRQAEPSLVHTWLLLFDCLFGPFIITFIIL